MNIYLVRPKEDLPDLLEANDDKRYYSFYTRSHGSVVTANSPDEARKLVEDSETDEGLWLEEQYTDCLHLGTSIDPYNKVEIIHSSGGTG